MIEKKMLFTPGPVMTSDAVKSVLLQPDIPHRQPVFEGYVRSLRAQLLRLFRADDAYTAVVITGSGTAANETALSSIFKTGEGILLLKNGEFGDRLQSILDCYQLPVTTLDFGWAGAYDLERIEAELAAHPGVRWISMVYHETSTGMLNPAGAVGALATRHQVRLFADCVSAVGGEPLDVVGDSIDVCTGVPNKSVSGLPGVSFVCVRRTSVPAAGGDVPRRNIYLNLQQHIEWSDQADQTPNTPAVTMFVALDAALQELFSEGLEARRGRYRECARLIRDGLEAMGLRLLLPPEQRSNTVTSAFLPPGVNVSEFIAQLDRRGFVVYPGKGPFLAQNMFQVANMGWILPDDCRTLLREISATIESVRRPHGAEA
jgi:2-aminoethylphosphonate-pyruvate transaminase